MAAFRTECPSSISTATGSLRRAPPTADHGHHGREGRGVRTISDTDFNAVTPDARGKERFVVVDAAGVTESELSESYSLDRHPSVPFDKLLDMVAMGDREPDTLSSLASRLAFHAWP